MATILILNGRHEGEWYTIGDRPLVLGRDESLLADILDPRISRKHLEVAYDFGKDACIATDLRSRNGTKLNGAPLIHPTPLKEGDILQIGHTLLAYTLDDFEDADDAKRHLAQLKPRVAPQIADFEKREEYTEAAALFSRLFKRRS